DCRSGEGKGSRQGRATEKRFRSTSFLDYPLDPWRAPSRVARAGLPGELSRPTSRRCDSARTVTINGTCGKGFNIVGKMTIKALDDKLAIAENTPQDVTPCLFRIHRPEPSTGGDHPIAGAEGHDRARPVSRRAGDRSGSAGRLSGPGVRRQPSSAAASGQAAGGS